MRAFNFPCISDLVEFYGMAVMPLAAVMNHYGCGEMKSAALAS
jgi:hypothetical protein